MKYSIYFILPASCIWLVAAGCASQTTAIRNLERSLEARGISTKNTTIEEELKVCVLSDLIQKELRDLCEAMPAGTIFVYGLTPNDESAQRLRGNLGWQIQVGLDNLEIRNSKCYDKRTKKQGILIWAKIVSVSDGKQAIVTAGWRMTPMAAAVFKYRVSKATGRWEIESVKLEFIS